MIMFGMQYHELHFFHEPFGDHDCRVPNLTSSRHRLWCMFAHRQAVRSVLGQKRGFEDLLFAIEYYSNAAFHSAFVCGVNVRVCTELILPTRSIFGDCARPFLHSELRPEPSCSLYTHSCCSISCVAVGPCRLRAVGRGPVPSSARRRGALYLPTVALGFAWPLLRHERSGQRRAPPTGAGRARRNRTRNQTRRDQGQRDDDPLPLHIPYLTSPHSPTERSGPLRPQRAVDVS